MRKNRFINIIILKIFLVSNLLFFAGCEVHPNETVNSFLNSVKEKKIEQAGKYCTAGLRGSLNNFPSALKNYKYGIKKINFEFNDLQKTKDGLVALIKVKVDERNWPPPKVQYGLMRIYLEKSNKRWYINSIDVETDLIEFKKHPVPGVKPKEFNDRPFWILSQRFSGSLSNLLYKYNNACLEWEQ